MKSCRHSSICLNFCLNLNTLYAESIILVRGTIDVFLKRTHLLQGNIFFKTKIIVVPL